MADKPQKTKGVTIDELKVTADLARNVVHLALERTALDLAAGNIRDPAKAAHSASLAMGIGLTKIHELEDRPPPEPEIWTEAQMHAETNALFRRLNIPLPQPEPVESPAWSPTPSGQLSPSPRSSPTPSPTRSLPSPPSQALLSPGATLSADLEAIARDLDDLTFDAKQRRDGSWLRIPGSHADVDDSAVELVRRLTE